MRSPKALLEFKDKTTLLEKQTKTLLDGGCFDVAVVVGSDAEKLISGHPNLQVSWVINKNWERGQFSSLQKGLGFALENNSTGAIILPVDVAGIKTSTVRAILENTFKNSASVAIVPEYKNKRGHPIYLSNKIFELLTAMNPSDKDARLDVQLKKLQNITLLPVEDPQILKNINTPSEWLSF